MKEWKREAEEAKRKTGLRRVFFGLGERARRAKKIHALHPLSIYYTDTGGIAMKTGMHDGVRAALTVAVVLAEVACGVALLLALGAWAAPVYAVIQALAGVLLICLMGGSENGAYRAAWMGCTLVLGPAGVLLYLLFGRRHHSRTARLSSENMNRVQSLLAGQGSVLAPEDGQPAHYLAARGFPIYPAGVCQYLPTGEEFLAALIADIAQARVSVDLEFFIIGPGKILDDLLKSCTQAHERGVVIRLLIDDIGTLLRKDKRLCSRLAQAGIELRVFNPIARHAALLTLNFRDHRKIAVIDGRVAYTGGVNIADEYANLFSKHGYWKDTGIRIEGEAAAAFTAFFCALWAAAEGRRLDALPDRPVWDGPSIGRVQPYQSGPAGGGRSCASGLHRLMITSARRRVWIATPYLLLDETLESALCLAAQSGVDVRLILPGIPDHRAVELAGEAHYPALLHSGVRLYRYLPGFVHAKLCLCDDTTASVGTVNLDFRSLYLHFEDGVLLRDVPAVQDVRRDMEEMMSKSEEVPPEVMDDSPPLTRVARAVLRAVAPML